LRLPSGFFARVILIASICGMRLDGIAVLAHGATAVRLA
jgi:hypothetical protein